MIESIRGGSGSEKGLENFDFKLFFRGLVDSDRVRLCVAAVLDGIYV